jgi:hypothetical protein
MSLRLDPLHVLLNRELLESEIRLGELRYSDDQPRDDHGRFASGGDSGDPSSGGGTGKGSDGGGGFTPESWQTAAPPTSFDELNAQKNQAADFAASAFSGGTLSGSQADALTAYSRDEGAAEINDALRQGSPDSTPLAWATFLSQGDTPENLPASQVQTLGDVRTSLDSAIASSQATQDVVAYRGFGEDMNLEPGQVFSDPGYTSTSLQESMAAERFSDGTVAEIQIPAGSPALSRDNSLGGSQLMSEVILPRNASFEVTSTDGPHPILTYTP